MRPRTLAVALACAGVVVSGIAVAVPAGAATTTAKKPAVVGKPTAPGKPTVAPGRPTAKPTAPGKPTAKPTQARQPFTVTGTLTAVDPAASTVTVLVKGGKTVRGSAVVVSVAPTATISLDDQPSTLDALPAGAHVTAIGTVSGGVKTATRVNASTTG